MADMNPYVYAIGTGVGGGIAYVGKLVADLITSTIKYERTRADRLEDRVFTLQEIIYPALEASSSALREAIADKAAKKEG